MSQTSHNVVDTHAITALDESKRHRLLANDRRRLVLDVLEERPAAVGLEELAGEVAAREDGLDAAREETVYKVLVSLHHLHLPKMTDIGVISYDPDAQQITQ
jgi:Fe2+ or Zn2+ uptake regulation protein